MAQQLNLPEPVAAFFAAYSDAEAAARCFTNSAVVEDDGRVHHGITEIKQWKSEILAKYTYTCEPVRVEQNDETTVVTCHLEGNFPGGIVDLRFFFRPERGKIASLRIIP